MGRAQVFQSLYDVDGQPDQPVAPSVRKAAGGPQHGPGQQVRRHQHLQYTHCDYGKHDAGDLRHFGNRVGRGDEDQRQAQVQKQDPAVESTFDQRHSEGLGYRRPGAFQQN